MAPLESVARKQAEPATPAYRSAPHNIEAEQALLGAILVNNEALYRVSDFLEPEHFFEPIHQRIFQLARELIRNLPERSDADKKQKFMAEVQLLREAKEYQAAYDMLAKASAADPADSDLIYEQAMVAEKLDRLDEMERLLRKLMAMKPDNQNAYNALGYSLADRNIRLEEARELIRKAVSLAPDDPSISDSLGWSWYLRGDLDRAIPLLERAAQGAPAESDINEHLGDAYWKANRRLAARYAWRAALVAADGEQASRLKTKIDFGLTVKP